MDNLLCTDFKANRNEPLSSIETIKEAWGCVKGIKFDFFLCSIVSLVIRSMLIAGYIAILALFLYFINVEINALLFIDAVPRFLITVFSLIFTCFCKFIWGLPLLTLSYFIFYDENTSLINLKYIFCPQILFKWFSYFILTICFLIPCLIPIFMFPSVSNFGSSDISLSLNVFIIAIIFGGYQVIVSAISGLTFWIFYFLILDKSYSGQECNFFQTLIEAFSLLFHNFWYITFTLILMVIINSLFVSLTLGIGLFWAIPFYRMVGILMYDKIKDRN